MKCSIDGCERLAIARGWCLKHYKRWRNNGDPNICKRIKAYNCECSVSDCKRPARTHRMCKIHADRYFRRGRLHTVIRKRGTGSIDGKYKKFTINGKSIREHRLVWEKHNGSIPEGYVIHHKDGNGLNNSIENLEMMTRAEHVRHHDPGFQTNNLTQRKAQATHRKARRNVAEASK